VILNPRSVTPDTYFNRICTPVLPAGDVAAQIAISRRFHKISKVNA
jgi:hypothetical protein